MKTTTRALLTLALLFALALLYFVFIDTELVCVNYKGEGMPCDRKELTLWESLRMPRELPRG